MFEVSVTYLLRDGAAGPEVLLGEKLTGLGAGKLVGPGGKLEAGETSTRAAVREVLEEVGIIVLEHDLEPIGRLRYEFPHRPSWSQASSAFIARRWSGDPVPSDELAPAWYPLAELPLARMWHDARLWLPDALGGAFVDADCSYAQDNDTVAEFVRTGDPPPAPGSVRASSSSRG